MRHIIKINEWKTSEDKITDTDNIYEIEDIFLPIRDLSIDRFKIEAHDFIPHSYSISWDYNFSFSISNGVNSDSIIKQKDRIARFIQLQDEVRYVIEQLIRSGYTVPYYHCSENNSECYYFNIRISKPKERKDK